MLKRILFFGTPCVFAISLIVLVLSWFNVYENQLNEPVLALFFYFGGGILLLIWFHNAARERFVAGLYSKHFLNSRPARFLIIVLTVILFSESLVMILEGMAGFGRSMSLIAGIILSVISVALITLVAEMIGETIPEMLN